MASLDSLPADQRAVLQLVLQRGRSYDEIAKLLSIDRAAVRERALGAFDALGPRTEVPAERRALITDYVLGQLPAQVSETTRDRLADSPTERAWARVVASELAPLATDPLPEIPVEPTRAEPAREERRRQSGAERAGRSEPSAVARAAANDDPDDVARRAGLGGDEPPPERRASRRGGALILGLAAAVVVIAVVVILVVTGGGSSKKPSTQASTTPPTSTTAAGATSTTGSSTSTTATKVISQTNLTPPDSASKAAGIAEVLQQGATKGIAIVAQGVPANTKHDAYAVWLYNSPADAVLLGFVNPGVGSNGRLSTAGALPPTAGRFKDLVVTLETQAKPKQPGKIVLKGTLTGLS
jgi:hypothetical protein